MPCVHGRRTSGVAAALRHTGNRMFLSGPSSKAKIKFEYRYDSVRAKSSFGENVFVYEEDQIFKNPPDVMIVTREDNEEGMFQLWRELSRKKPIVICSYSGVFQSRFSWNMYRGHICCDLPSRTLSKYYDVPSIKFQPMFDFARYPYVPFEPSGPFAFRSYVNGLSWRFPKATMFHGQCRAELERAFGDRILVENIEKVGPSEAQNLMCKSAATLHIKDEEGFGWSVLESLSTGRPLIVQAGLSKNMTFNDWLIPGVTGFSFEDPTQLVDIARWMIEEPERLVESQQRASEHLREIFAGERYAYELGNFLEDLWRVERSRWIAGKPTPEEQRSARPYEASLDPEFKQDYERLLEESASMKVMQVNAGSSNPVFSESQAAGAAVNDRTKGRSISTSFTYGEKLLTPDSYGNAYLNEFRSVLNRFLKIQTGYVLEWGSGFTTREVINALEKRGCELFISIDDNGPYLKAVANDLEEFLYFKPVLQSQTGAMRGADDAGPNYSSYPLTVGRKFDFIFIDGRRRVECAYSAALLSHPDTIVVMHDYRRDRYQSVLALFDVLEDGPEFRVMRIKKAALSLLSKALAEITPKFRQS